MSPLADRTATSLLAAHLADVVSRTISVREQFRLLCLEGHELGPFLPELGRIRELSFRAAGQGTGLPRDLSPADPDAHHILIWDHELRQMAGALRLHVLAEAPPATPLEDCFSFTPAFWAQYEDGLEIGRLFLHPDYASQNSLLLRLLWHGVDYYLDTTATHHPTLFGVLSLPAGALSSYQYTLMQYLEQHHLHPGFGSLVRSKRAPLPEPCLAVLAELPPAYFDLPAVQAFVRQKGHPSVPALFRLYSHWQAELLCTHLDPSFNNSLDFLLAIDLRNISTEMARWFLPRLAKIRQASAVA